MEERREGEKYCHSCIPAVVLFACVDTMFNQSLNREQVK